MTKLQAVQMVLRAIGRSTISALDTDGISDAANAERILDEVELEVQSRGFRYNRRENVTLSPDVDDHIAVPTGAIVVFMGATQSRSLRFTKVGGRLYDVTNNTDEFDGDVIADYLVRESFGCIPHPIQEYIARLACERFNDQYGGSLQAIQSRKTTLAVACREAKIEANRFNDTDEDVNVLATYDAWAGRGFRERNTNSPSTGRI